MIPYKKLKRDHKACSGQNVVIHAAFTRDEWTKSPYGFGSIWGEKNPIKIATYINTHMYKRNLGLTYIFQSIYSGKNNICKLKMIEVVLNDRLGKKAKEVGGSQHKQELVPIM